MSQRPAENYNLDIEEGLTRSNTVLTARSEEALLSSRTASILALQEADHEKGEDIEIAEDVYGAFLFTCIFDTSRLISGIQDHGFGNSTDVRYFRILFISCCLVANFVLQIGMLYWIYAYVVLTAVHKVQAIYQDYHADCFDGGVYKPERWENWPEYKQRELCGIAFSNFWFMFSILSLWWASNANEIRKTERLLRNIQAMPSTRDPDVMVHVSDDNAVRLQALTSGIRSVLLMFLIVPKLIISIALLVVGTTWLVATDSFSDLILNAIALEFVIQVDELFYQAFVPRSIHTRLKTTSLWLMHQKTDAERDQEIRWGYGRSCLYLFGIGIGVWSYLVWGQELPLVGVFPGFKYDASCPVYTQIHTQRICQEDMRECFPIG